MQSLRLKDNFYWIGAQDKDLRVFDIIMYTEFGTTYNSYLAVGTEKIAVFETVKAAFFDEYLEKLTQIVDVRKIDYLVVSHTEPDHAGSVEKMIELNPEIRIVGTAGALGFLKHIVNRDFHALPVKENVEIALGGKTLRFMPLPNLHWPDTMYTYIPEDRALVTCDSFGSHYAHEGVLRSNVDDAEGYLRATKYYFDNIIGPFKRPFMVNALKKIQTLDYDMICPGHGPVLDVKLDEIVSLYQTWCDEGSEKKEKKSVAIAYVTAYGYTKALAQAIENGIHAAGDIDVKAYNVIESDAQEVNQALAQADGILLGSPTILGEALPPIWNLTTSMFPVTHGGKVAGAFGSYGWSGEAVGHLTERLNQLRMKVVEGFRVRFKPSDEQLKEAEAWGKAFGEALLK